MFEAVDYEAHEGVHVFSDPAVGLKAVIAVHSTVRGPAAGGTRFWTYAREDDAVTDALRLSRGMSYKNAMADLPFGGGKGVLLKPESPFDRDALFASYGRCIAQLAGRYVTAEDVGVTPADMAVIARETPHVAGLDDGLAASGDPSPVTALGVFEGLRACVRRRLQRDDLTGLTVGVQGLGHVGALLCGHLAKAGVRLVVSDLNQAAVADVVARFGAEAVAPEAFYDAPMDVFAPCALGAVLNRDTLPRLQCSIVAGGANNQLSEPEMGVFLQERGVLYAPDYVINGGGIINVAAEILARRANRAYDRAWVDQKLFALIATLEAVLDTAIADQRPTHEVADLMAHDRLKPVAQPEPA